MAQQFYSSTAQAQDAGIDTENRAFFSGSNVSVGQDSKTIFNPMGTSLNEAAQKAGFGSAQEAREAGYSFVDTQEYKAPSVITGDNAQKETEKNVSDLQKMQDNNNQTTQTTNETDQNDQIDEMTKLLENNPAAREIKAASDQLDSIVKQQNDQLLKMQDSMDAQHQSLISNIRSTFESRKNQMRQVNENLLGGTKLLGVRSGRQRYARELNNAIVSKEESDGIARLTEIDNQMNQAILQAEQAKTSNDFQLLNQMMTNAKELYQQKITTAVQLNQMASEYDRQLMEKAKFALETQEYMDDQAEKYADLAAINLVNIDESGNIVLPDSSQLEAAANTYGIGSDVLMAKIKQRTEEVNKLNQEDRRAELEMYQLQQEVANYGMSNLQKEYEYAVDNYGYNGSMFDYQQDIETSKQSPYDVIKSQLEIQKLQMDIEQGIQADVDFEKIILNGEDYLKYEDGRLVKASEVVGNKTNILNAESSLAQVDLIKGLYDHQGMRQAVGPNFARRGPWQYLVPGSGVSPLEVLGGSTERKEFLGFVQQLVDDVTLKKLIEVKGQGATFGSLSDSERAVIERAATPINQWKIKDKNGNVVGYDISEESFKKELKRLEGLATDSAKKDLGIKYLDYNELIQDVPEQKLQQMLGNSDFGNTIEERRNKILQYYNQGGTSFNNVGADTNQGSQLGELSSKYESGGNAGAIGYDRTGGKSYGIYQLAHGSAERFVNAYPVLKQKFSGLKYGTKAWDDKWKSLGNQDEKFKNLQHDYIAKSYFDPQINKLAKAGINTSSFSPVLKDVIFSTAVQHGANTNVIENAIKRVGTKDEKRLIEEIYKERWSGGKRFASSTPAVKKAVYNRFFGKNGEMNRALNMLR